MCFDTGGMEDMKGDIAGAACVVGPMHAPAAREAKVNAVGGWAVSPGSSPAFPENGGQAIGRGLPDGLPNRLSEFINLFRFRVRRIEV